MVPGKIRALMLLLCTVVAALVVQAASQGAHYEPMEGDDISMDGPGADYDMEEVDLADLDLDDDEQEEVPDPEEDADVLKDVLDEQQEDEDSDAEPEREFTEESTKYPLTNIPKPLTGVEVFSAVAPLEPALSLGQDAEAKITFANNAKVPLHIWGIMGSLNVEKNFRNYVQNFSYALVNSTIPGSSQQSMIYSFQADERLVPQKYQLALTVFYEKASAVVVPLHASYANTFFNETITVDHAQGAITNQIFYGIIITIALAVLGGIGGYKFYQSQQKNKSRAQRYETGTRTTVDEDWVSDHEQMVNAGGGRAKSKKGTAN